MGDASPSVGSAFPWQDPTRQPGVIKGFPVSAPKAHRNQPANKVGGTQRLRSSALGRFVFLPERRSIAIVDVSNQELRQCQGKTI
jgi:hypothetical protein